MSEFDLREFLVENTCTCNSKLLHAATIKNDDLDEPIETIDEISNKGLIEKVKDYAKSPLFSTEEKDYILSHMSEILDVIEMDYEDSDAKYMTIQDFVEILEASNILPTFEEDLEENIEKTTDKELTCNCKAILFNATTKDWVAFDEYEEDPEESLIFSLGDGDIYQCYVTVDNYDEKEDNNSRTGYYYEPKSLKYVGCDWKVEVKDNEVVASGNEVPDLNVAEFNDMLGSLSQADIEDIVIEIY